MNNQMSLDKYKQVSGEHHKVVIENLKIISFEGKIAKYIDDLVRLDTLCLGDYEAWTKKNFLVDLPQKGRLSKLALLDGKLMGYIICSLHCGKGHIHRLAVNPVCEKSGIAAKLLKEFLATCLALGISEITVEAPLRNVAANSLYQSRGFSRLEGQELEDYMLRKGKKEKVKHYIGDLATRVVYGVKIQELSWSEEDKKDT